MSKNVLVISTSPRRNGNSKLLADAFANGARQAGNSVENISLHDKTICFCKGCLSCQKSQRCVIHDDADTIAQKMKAFSLPTSSTISTLAPSIVPNVRAPFNMNFMLPVHDASLEDVEI